METLNYDKLEECRQTIKNVKALLLDAVMEEIKRTEVDEWNFDTEISAHYPHSGSILVHNIETLSIDGSTIVCGCSIGDPGSQERKLITCYLGVFDCETILETLTQLRKELRELRLTVLKDVVRSHGGLICFDGSFKFTGDCEDRDSKECGDPCEDCSLTKLEIVGEKLVVFDTWQGEPYDNSTDFIPDYELDRIVSYAKQQPYVDISLNEEQLKAVEEFRTAMGNLTKHHVNFLVERDKNILQFYNDNPLLEVDHSNDIGPCDKGWVCVQGQLDKNPSIKMRYYYYGTDEKICVKPIF